MNKANLVKKIASGANISTEDAARALDNFLEAVTPETEVKRSSSNDDFLWRGGATKKGGRTKYMRT